jgi:hypothetical protein
MATTKIATSRCASVGGGALEHSPDLDADLIAGVVIELIAVGLRPLVLHHASASR